MTTRVAILYAPQLDIGGVEEHLKALFQFQDPGFEWVVFAAFTQRFEKSSKTDRVSFVEWRPKKTWDISALFGLIRLIRERQISLLHIHSPEVSVVGKLAALFTQTPSVVTIHLAPSEYFQGTGLFARIKKKAYLFADACLSNLARSRTIYVSGQTREAETKRTPYSSRSTLVINVGVDVGKFSAARMHREETRATFKIPPKTVVLCFVGRLQTQKGVDVLLKVFKSIEPSDQTRLWIVGEGEKSEEYTSYARTNGLQNVVFWGFREDVEKFLAAADIFVLPSRFEAMPIALLEAMAAGVACVVTDVGENRTVITNGVNGLLVPPENENDLRYALVRLIGDSDLRTRLGKAASESVKQFSNEKMVERIIAVYRLALTKGST